MADEFYKILLILCVGQGMTFSALLLFKSKGIVKANQLLAIFILLTIVPIWNDYAHLLPAEFGSWTISFSWLYIPAFYGPILYLYAFYYTGGKALDRRVWFWLGVLPVIGAGLRAVQSYVIEGGFSNAVWLPWYGLIFIQISICIFFGWKCVSRLEQNLRQNLSNLDKAKTIWLKQLLIAYLGLLVLNLVFLIGKLSGVSFVKSLQLLVSISESVFIFMLGFWGLNKSNTIFHELVVVNEQKYKNSGLTKQKAHQIIENLNRLMDEEELFLDNEVSLMSLSERLKETPHNLSQALNESMQQNFYDYINSARIKRAQIMLQDPGYKESAIIDIAYQVGFNNKTSFNNSFKKFTNTTPSQYRSDSL